MLAIRVSIAAVVLVVGLGISGCAPQAGTRATTGSPNDPDAQISSVHWEFYAPGDDDGAMASVVSEARDAIVNVLCDEDGLGLVIWSHDGAELKEPSFNVAFDGGRAESYDWVNISDREGWAFGLSDDHGEFWKMITALKQRNVMEAIVSASGKEWRHHRFALAKADEAINRVIRHCMAP